jgi:hypothetical protein
MNTDSIRRTMSPESSTVSVLRIMRAMPIGITVPLRIELRVGIGGLVVRKGVRVVVGGAVRAGGFGARLTYRQSDPQGTTPVVEVSSERIALPDARTQPVPPRELDRASSNDLPDLWVQFLDGHGSPITAPARLGRCDGGPYELCPNLPVGLSIDAAITKRSGSNGNPQATLAIGGEVRIRSGLVVRLSLSERGDGLMHPIEGTTPADLILFPVGMVVPLRPRALPCALGRDSWVLLTFLDGAGRATGSEWLLGRANAGPTDSKTTGAGPVREQEDSGGRWPPGQPTANPTYDS